MGKTKMAKARTAKEKMEMAKEKMARERTRVKNHVTSSQKQKKDATKDNVAKDITVC